MADLHVTLNGLAVERATISIPHRGPWFADVDLVDGRELTGRATLKIGAATFAGTLEASGVFVGRSRCRLVAGANGWSKLLPRRGYHDDAGIRAHSLAEDAAREAGETLTAFAGAAERLGSHYARAAAAASHTLEKAAAGADWWVDRAGLTRVGARPTKPAKPRALLVQNYDARERLLELACDDLGAVDVGTVVADERLPEPLTIRALEISITPSAVRVKAWCGSEVVTEIADTLVAIARHAAGAKLLGVYRYRVVTLDGQRVNVQAVDAPAGVPDLLSVDMWPGVAGSHATLKLGGEVLVQFVNGNENDPVITGFRGGHTAVPSVLELGGPNGAEVVTKGSPVECLMPPAIFTGTIGGVPASGVLTYPLMKIPGTNTGGTPKVKAAS